MFLNYNNSKMDNQSLPKLSGKFVNLEPTVFSHMDQLEKHFSAELTRHFPRQFSSANEYFSKMVTEKYFGPVQLFTIVHNQSTQPIGCTGLFYVDASNRKVEIGGSGIGKTFQGTEANAESKLLLLKYAFDELKCLRVGFSTDLLNLQSQGALEKLGAKREGVLRNHLVLPNGRSRHSVLFSIIAEEWDEVSKNITTRI